MKEINTINLDETLEPSPEQLIDETVGLANCTCPFTTSTVPFDAATTLRIVDIPVRFSHLCPGKEFAFVVTVFSGNDCIGQAFATTVSRQSSCNIDHVQNVRVVIKKSLCSTDNITVRVFGNYVCSCNI